MFKGKVSIVAHSLGTVVTYDVLRKGMIPFSIQNFFIMGSPLGLFASVYQTEEPFVRAKLQNVGNIFNIYHPSDLIAYRIEPVIRNSKADDDPSHVSAPIVIPCHETLGLNQTQRFLQYFQPCLSLEGVNLEKFNNM
jgi:hypothetical protein